MLLSTGTNLSFQFSMKSVMYMCSQVQAKRNFGCLSRSKSEREKRLAVLIMENKSSKSTKRRQPQWKYSTAHQKACMKFHVHLRLRLLAFLVLVWLSMIDYPDWLDPNRQTVMRCYLKVHTKSTTTPLMDAICTSHWLQPRALSIKSCANSYAQHNKEISWLRQHPWVLE